MQGDREKTRGTEDRSTQLARPLPQRKNARSRSQTKYSFCFAFVLLRAVSSNPPPPPRLLPVVLRRPLPTLGADLDTPGRIAQHLIASRTALSGPWDRYHPALSFCAAGNETVYRCGSNASGLLGVPLTRISKYNNGEPCGPLPMVAMRWPAATASPSSTVTDCRWPYALR